MGEPLHCNLCGKPATVHLTQINPTEIVKNQIQKLALCEACAQTKGMTDPDVSEPLRRLLLKSKC